MNSFLTVNGLPTGDAIGQRLRSDSVKKVINFCLGPPGTNIGQAAQKWSEEIGITDKTKIVWCDTPEAALEAALKVEHGTLGIFWTCAVYYRLHELFFNNPGTLPFFINYTMPLDAMQLATRLEKVTEVNDSVPANWKIASHPSPAPLMTGWEIQLVNSNTAASEACAKGRVDACITTEAGRVNSDLVKIHEFGSPPMVFFGGITSDGARLLSQA